MLNLLNSAAQYADPLTKIGGFIAVLYGLWVWLTRLYAKQARSMSGDWTNEGDATAPPRSHSVRMSTTVRGSEASGTVQAWFEDGHSPLASIVGRRYGPFIKAEIWHLRHGKIEVYGKMWLHYRKGKMRFSSKPLANFYPVQAELWRIGPRP
jgi:hypothetical protein